MNAAFAPAVVAAAPPQGMPSLWDLVVSGGPLMWPIGLCSVLALGYAVERWLRLRPARLGSVQFESTLESAIESGGAPGGLAVCARETTPLARIMAEALHKAGWKRSEREKRVEEVASAEVRRLSLNLKPLLIVYIVAPLLGLLGTVWGLIECFATIATEEGLGKPELLASGVYQALVTTAAGLTIAIPTVVAYYWLKARVDRFARRTEELYARIDERLGERLAAEEVPVRIRDPEELGEPEFSMAPLIDIVFQLLIFFMVATTTKHGARERELGVELPMAQSAHEPEPSPDELVISVFRDGRLSLAGRDIARDELRGALGEAARANALVPVTIRGDRLVHHEDVVSVMDACGSAGLTNVAVGTLER